MITAPASWNVEPVRGCAVCKFGRDEQGRPTRPGGRDADMCICPHVTGRELPKEVPIDWPLGVPVRQARGNAGACGPEAYHLAFPGLV